MILDDSFAARLASVRADCLLSQAELAEKAGVAPAQISRYESGKNMPRPSIVAKLARVLDVSTEWLATGAQLSRGPSATLLQIKIPDDLLQVLQSDASYADRTLQAEIVRRLRLTVGSDPLALDPAQLHISMPNKLFNKIKRAAVDNRTLPNDEMVNRLTKSFDTTPNLDDPSPLFQQAERLADAQGLFAGVLAAFARKLIESHGPEALGLDTRKAEAVYRVLSKSLQGMDFDESDYVDLIGIASLVGAIQAKPWPPASGSESATKKT